MSSHHIPESFITELQKATASSDIGKIYLLAREVSGVPWESAALQAILHALAKEFRALHSESKHSLIFSGHMIDSANREQPRFPSSKEEAAAKEIRLQLQHLKKKHLHSLQGFAGGASGGDILFHELCLSLNMPTVIFLALPPELFVSESVQPAGKRWVERFYSLCEKLPVKVLDENKESPDWITDESYSIWQRTNDWMMQSAFALSGDQCSLMALWDEKAGDGPGGTKQMVDEIKKLKQQVIIINPNHLSV